MRNKYIPIIIGLVLSNLLLAWGVYAQVGTQGALDSPGAPTDPASASYTLENIYQRLDTGATGSESTFTEPVSGPMVGTMHSLNEIMTAAPVANDTNGATMQEVLGGKTAWGLTSEQWGLITGTMSNVGQQNITPGTSNQTITQGYHDGSGYVEGDADLVPENIKCGVTIFGVAGSGLPGCVAKTGQTASYGTGDDGTYEKGCLPVVAPSFGYSFEGYNRTSLSCSAGFTDNGDGTVTDNLTGLIWLKNANCFGERNWTQALSDANGLASGDCGLTDGSSAGDWRLPNLNELRSLFDPGLSSPFLPAGHPFTGVQSDIYWSSTTYAVIPDLAWDVALSSDGLVLYGDKSWTRHVWPVHGGQ